MIASREQPALVDVGAFADSISDGDAVSRAYADAVAAVIVDVVGPMGAGVALVAQGGLARRQLVPWADVDLLFLLADDVDAAVIDVGGIVARLWDAGLKASWAVRHAHELKGLFDDVSGKNGHAATALLESRVLAGDVAFGVDTLTTLRRTLGPERRGRLLKEKLREARTRRARAFFSPALVEPNLKEGPGGLRDIHLLIWAAICQRGIDLGASPIMADADAADGDADSDVGDALVALLRSGTLFPSEVSALRAVRSELLTLRWALALSSKGRDQRLHAAVAEGAAAVLHLEGDGSLRPGELMVRRAVMAMRQCLVVVDDALQRLVPTDQGLWPERPREPTTPEGLGALLAQIEPTRLPGPLTGLLERGILGALLPDLQRLLGRVKHDGIHAFCTDAHLARCGDIALGVVGGATIAQLGECALPASLEPIRTRLERPVVVVAGALFHDIGKGLPGDHSVVGEELARRELPALGLHDDDIDDVCFIVRHHLLLSTTAQRSDLGDPRVIDELTAIIASPQRLDALALVTWCDWCAVGPGIGTAWKARLLADCVDAVREALLQPQRRAKDATSVRARAKDALRAHQGTRRYGDDLITRFVDGASVPWLRGRTKQALIDDLEAFAQLEPEHGAGAVVMDVMPQRAWVRAADRPGLLADLAAAFASEGASVLDARLDVRDDGQAFDCFVFADGSGGVVSKDGCILLEAALRDALAGDVRATSRRAPKANVPVRVRFLDDNDPRQIIVEVRGPDRRALLHDLARVFAAHHLSISLARLHTEGARVTDVFRASRADGGVVAPADRELLGRALRDAMLPG